MHSNLENDASVDAYQDIDSSAASLIHEMSFGVALVKVNDDFELISANEYFYEMFETDKDDYKKGIFSRFGNADKEMYVNYLRNQISETGSVVFEFKTVKKNSDELIYVRAQAKRIVSGGERLYAVWFLDITKEKNLALENDSIKNLYLKAISSSDEMIFEYQVAEDILIYYKLVEENGIVVNQPNVRSDFLKNLESNKDVYPDDLVYFYDLCRDNLTHPFDVRFRRNGQNPGEYTRMRVHATVQKNGNKISRIIGTIRPVEIIKSDSGKNSPVMELDELTGLDSRSKAKMRIEEYLLNSTVASSFALLILDIKDFKRVNDTFGHLFGDNVLVQVADCLIENTKRNDIVGRLGGDEFLIFIKNASKSAIESICDKICRGIRNIYVGEDIAIDAYIGAVVIKDPSKTYDELLRTADDALFNIITKQKTGYYITEEILQKPTVALNRSYIADRNIRTADGSREKRLSELIFELLEQAKDLDRAIDTVLSLVGEKKNLSRITIMRRDGNELLVTRQWLSRGIKARKEISAETFFEYQEKMRSNFAEDGMGVVSLETAKRYDPVKISKILDAGAKSVMYCNMMEFGEVAGVIAFVDCDKERDWSDIDYKAYRTITRMISAYTLKTEAINKNKI